MFASAPADSFYFSVYILDCADSSFYIAQSSDVATRVLTEYRIEFGLSQAGNCYDSVTKQSIQGTLNRTAVGGEAFDSIAQARVTVIRDGERFYNRIRRHRSLG